MGFPFKFNRHGRGVGRKPGVMNGIEREYAAHLESLRIAGKIEWYVFDAVKLRLAENTFYTPDFFVMLANGEIEVREVKGFWEDDARVKIKVAADKFPFRFIGVTKRTKKSGGGWEMEYFSDMPAGLVAMPVGEP